MSDPQEEMLPAVVQGMQWYNPKPDQLPVREGPVYQIVNEQAPCLDCVSTPVSMTNRTLAEDNVWDLQFLLLWIQLVGILTLTVITIVGNGMVIMTFLCTSGHKKATNCLIISLAVVDLLIGVLFPMSATSYVVGRWPIGHVTCKLFLLSSHLLLDVAMLCTLLITIDRWWSINKPFMYRVWQSRRKALIIIASVWLTGLLLYSPAFALWPNWDEECYELCVPPFRQNIAFSFSVGLVEFCIPTFVVVWCNVSIYRRVLGRRDSGVRRSMTTLEYLSYSSTASLAPDEVLLAGAASKVRPPRKMSLALPQQSDYITNYLSSRRSAVQIQRPLIPQKSSPGYLPRCRSDPDSPQCDRERPRDKEPLKGRRVSFDTAMLCEQSRKNRRQSTALLSGVQRTSELMVKEMLNRQNRKAARALILLVSTFLVCWCPYALVKIIGPFLPNGMPFLLYRCSEWLCYFNSSLNPLLHVLGNAQFAKRLRYFLGLRTRRKALFKFEALRKLPVILPDVRASTSSRGNHHRNSSGDSCIIEASESWRSGAASVPSQRTRSVVHDLPVTVSRHIRSIVYNMYKSISKRHAPVDV